MFLLGCLERGGPFFHGAPGGLNETNFGISAEEGKAEEKKRTFVQQGKP
jgi:hypothetical protein